MNIIYYLLITALGIGYFILAALTDMDFLIGRFSLGIPYATIGWGLSGIFKTPEPYAFVIGFMVPFLFIGIIYTYMTTSGKKMENLLLKQGIVTIPIKPNKKGEIKIKRADGGLDFYIAGAKNIIKPIPKGTEVKIIEVDGMITYVSSDLKKIKPNMTRSNFYFKMSRLIQFLAPRPKISGTCMICYGGLIKSKQGLRCPSCLQVAHKDHMRKWLTLKDKCPNCKALVELSGNKLIKIKVIN